MLKEKTIVPLFINGGILFILSTLVILAQLLTDTVLPIHCGFILIPYTFGICLMGVACILDSNK